MMTGESGLRRFAVTATARLRDAATRPALAVLAACLLGGTAAQAEDKYPSKPVRVVVSFSAGGPTDTVARIMGARMGALMGQQFVVENRVGAGGNIGADMVAKSPPDGYTLLMTTSAIYALLPNLRKTLPYDPVKDFVPISRIATASNRPRRCWTALATCTSARRF